MSKDIRSYFFDNKKSCHDNVKESGNQSSKKRNRRILDSDEEDSDIVLHGQCNSKKYKETEGSGGSKVSNKKEVVVQVENFFGNIPVLQKKQKATSLKKSVEIENKSTVEKETKQKSKKEAKSFVKSENLTFECDDELEASILETDDEMLITGVSSDKIKKEEELKIFKKVSCDDTKVASKKRRDNEKDESENCTMPSSSAKKKKNFEAYHKYLHRPGPKHPGSKEIPMGSPTCLKGLIFVITGILDSLEREEAVALIEKCGGRITSQVSKKTNFVVVGEQPGESKIHKADMFGTEKINEDDLIRLIKEKSNNESKKKDEYIEGTPEKNSRQFNSIKKHKTEINKMEIDASPSKLAKNEDESQKNSVGTQFANFHAAKIVTKNVIPSEKELDDVPISDDILWVEKYKPKSTKAIVGQGGDKSNVKKLIHWLQNWNKNHGKCGKKLSRPAPWAQNDDGGFFKAALLSGPPGVGKTTTAHLVCRELGLDVIEFNASDTRSKRLLQEDVSELLSSKSLKGFLQECGKSHNNQVLVMDEVDGMAGNEDRGGMQELIQLIKQTKIPIIGICNDRNHPKIRSLVNYCFDLRFQRPPVKQIKAAMMSICFKENINISGDALEELIISSNHDLRQVLHKLSLLTFVDKSLSLEDAKQNSFEGKKPLNLGPWDVVRKLFSASEQDKLSLNDKIDLFFQDYSLGPLFVQDSYLQVKPHKANNSKIDGLALISEAADSIALGDVVERVIRNQNSWNLLPVQAIFSSVVPSHKMSGHFTGKIDFPVWLGKNSKMRKMSRILQELYTSLSSCISGDCFALNLDYIQHLKLFITRPLIEKGSEGVQESVKFMLGYCLLKEDFDHILELSLWPGFKEAFSCVDSKVKAAFTRSLNKECQRVSCVSKKFPKDSVDRLDLEVEGEGEENAAEEDNDSVDIDPMIRKGKLKKITKSEFSDKGKNQRKEGTSKKEKGKKEKKAKNE